MILDPGLATALGSSHHSTPNPPQPQQFGAGPK